MSGSDRFGKRIELLRPLIFCVAAAAVIVGAGIAGNYAAGKKNPISNSSHQTERPDENIVIDEKKTIKVGDREFALKENIETVLVMGVDDPGTQEAVDSYMNTDQADFNLLIVIDNENKSYTSLALNRDTMTKIPALGVDGALSYWMDGQLALGHTYGTGRQDSCLNQVWTVSELLFGENIDHYISFSLPAIGFANDAVGGVTVKIEDDFSKVDSTMKMGETIKLNAKQAEHYVRQRKNVAEQTNLNRMKRQKTYMAEWKNLAIKKINSDNTFFFKFLGLVSDYMVSDMSANKLSDMSNKLAEYTDNGMLETKGEAKLGKKFMEYYVDEDDLREIVLKLYYDEI
ncbi:MAG: LCP family protein [Clostridia bacterium]|nr:LCP family protein [Clostridia bacterium]